MNRLLYLKSRLRFLYQIEGEALTKALVIFALTFFGFLVFSQTYTFYIDTQDASCFKERLFIGKRLHQREVFVKGDYVSFIGSKTLMLNQFNGQRIVKKVIASTGDAVETKDGILYVNGIATLTQNPETIAKLEKRRAKPVELKKILERDEYLVAGDTSVSFDSRYWGVLHAYEIDSRLRPIL